MAEWIEVKDQLPEENSGGLIFTDGKRVFSGYYQKGRFIEETPPDASGVNIIASERQNIIGWMTKQDNEL
jgi:hypothetical protein